MTDLRRFTRYAAVGGLATAAHYLTLVAWVEGGHWPAAVGSGVGAAIGAQVAYFGNRWFTFAHRGALRDSWPRFQLTAAAAGLLGMAIVALAGRAGVHYLVAQVVATLIGLVVTFVINRAWAFR
jgi:putative flippase GtrA